MKTKCIEIIHYSTILYESILKSLKLLLKVVLTFITTQATKHYSYSLIAIVL